MTDPVANVRSQLFDNIKCALDRDLVELLEHSNYALARTVIRF